MADIAGVFEAVQRFVEEYDPHHQVALILTGGELATLHFGMELMQECLEALDDQSFFGEDLGTIRGKIERLLVQGGYGGDPRYGKESKGLDHRAKIEPADQEKE